MEKRFDYELEKDMDRAIMLLSQAFSQSGHNSKPVILHSIRVGLTLFDRGYSRQIVLAGLLHDILEDTDFPLEALKLQFGGGIADLVQAATFDRKISDKRERNREMFLRCRELGFDAMIVKCADILDNIDYFVPTPGYEALAELLMEKYQDFLKIGAELLSGEPIFAELKKKVHTAENAMAAFQTRKKQ